MAARKPKQTSAAALADLRPDAVLPLTEAAAEAHVSKAHLREALARGEIGGRLLGGPGGWLTTRQAILRWARGEAPGPQVETAPKATAADDACAQGDDTLGE